MSRTALAAFRRWSPTKTYNGGEEVAMRCPWHKGAHLNLWANTEKRVFTCFRCGEKGRWGALLWQIRRARPDAVSAEVVREELSAPPARRERPAQRPGGGQEAKSPETPAVVLPEGFAPLHGSGSTVGRRALRYLAERGVGAEEVELRGLGFCASGPYRSRVVVPVIEAGQVVYWVARDVTGRASRKVLNPPGAAKDHLFGIDLARRMGRATVVEGVFDAMAVGPSGVALLGKTAGARQVRMLLELMSVTVVLDSDTNASLGRGEVAAGDEALALVRRLLAHTTRPDLYVKVLDRGDPASCADLSAIPARPVGSQEDLLVASLGG